MLVPKKCKEICAYHINIKQICVNVFNRLAVTLKISCELKHKLYICTTVKFEALKIKVLGTIITFKRLSQEYCPV